MVHGQHREVIPPVAAVEVWLLLPDLRHHLAPRVARLADGSFQERGAVLRHVLPEGEAGGEERHVEEEGLAWVKRSRHVEGG